VDCSSASNCWPNPPKTQRPSDHKMAAGDLAVPATSESRRAPSKAEPESVGSRSHRRVRSVQPLTINASLARRTDADRTRTQHSDTTPLDSDGPAAQATPEVPQHWVEGSGYWLACPPTNPHVTSWLPKPELTHAQDEIQNFREASQILDAALHSKTKPTFPPAPPSSTPTPGTAPTSHHHAVPVPPVPQPRQRPRFASEQLSFSHVHGDEAEPNGQLGPLNAASVEEEQHQESGHVEDDGQEPCQLSSSLPRADSIPLPELEPPNIPARGRLSRSASSAAEMPLGTNKKLGLMDELRYITLKYIQSGKKSTR